MAKFRAASRLTRSTFKITLTLTKQTYFKNFLLHVEWSEMPPYKLLLTYICLTFYYVYERFFIFVTFFTFLTFLIFIWTFFLHLWLQAPALSSKCGQRHVGSRGTRLNTYLLWLELVLGVIVRLFRTEIVIGLGSLGWRLGDKVRLGLRSGTEGQIGLSRGRGKCPYICPSASRRRSSLRRNGAVSSWWTPSSGRTRRDSCLTIRHDTIRDVILTCAQKPTWVSLTYRTESTTKKWKQKN